MRRANRWIASVLASALLICNGGAMLIRAGATEITSKLQITASSGENTVTIATSEEETPEQSSGTYLTISADSQHIKRDYNQAVYLAVTNHSTVDAEYYLKCNNANTDLSMNFVYEGGEEQAAMLIRPSETQQIELSVFAQNAEKTSYSIPVTAMVRDGETFEEDATLSVPFTCDPGSGSVSIVQTGNPDAATLSTTYTITNVGNDDIADLGLEVTGEAANYVRIAPLVENYELTAGSSIEVCLIPDLAKMKADDVGTLEGMLQPTGGVSQVTADTSSATGGTSAYARSARTSSGTTFSIRADTNEIKTISASDLALHQSGNEFYDAHYDVDAFSITSSVPDPNNLVDMKDVTAQYWEEGNNQKNGVDTAEEFNAVLATLIDPTIGEMDYTVQSQIEYTDEDGVTQTVKIAVRTYTESADSSANQGDRYSYNKETDTITLHTVSYVNTTDYNSMIADAKDAAAEELNISLQQANQPMQAAANAALSRSEGNQFAMNCVVTVSGANLDALETVVSEGATSGLLDVSNLTLEKAQALNSAMRKLAALEETTRPARQMAKVLSTAANISETVIDVQQTADVLNDPTLSWGNKCFYTGLKIAKNVHTYVISGAIIQGGGVLGTAIGDGPGTIFGLAVGSVVSTLIDQVIESQFETFDEMMMALRYTSMGRQCTNRGEVISSIYLPEIDALGSEDEGLPGVLEETGLYVTTRMSDGKPLDQRYYNDELGGDSFRHKRETKSTYRVNEKTIATTVETGLSEVAIADLSGTDATASLYSGINDITREYDTDPGHYTVATNTTITVVPPADYPIGYVGDELPEDVQVIGQLPDFAIYPENIEPENTVIVGEQNTVNIPIYNLGTKGGYVNVTVQSGNSTIYTKDNIYIAPFSSETISFDWTPTAAGNSIRVSLSMPDKTTDGVELDTEEIDATNNTAESTFETRTRKTPSIASITDRIAYSSRNTPYLVALITDADDIVSVSANINGKNYDAALQGSSSGNVTAKVALSDLPEGTYSATVTVTYRTSESQTDTLQQNAQIILEQYGKISFQLGCSNTSVDNLMVVRKNESNVLETVDCEITRTLDGSATPECRIEYDPAEFPSLDDCYLLLRYSGSPGGLVVTPLAEVAGNTISLGEQYNTATIIAENNEEFSLNYVTEINGMQLADATKIQMPVDSDGNIYYTGADSIVINTRIKYGRQSNSYAYTKIPISKDKAEYTLSDYCTIYTFPMDYAFSGNSIQRIDVLLTDENDITTQRNDVSKSAYFPTNSTAELSLFLPFSVAPYQEVRAAIFHSAANNIVYDEVDLLAASPNFSKSECSLVSFRLADGSKPYSASVTVTRHGVGQAITASCTEMYLGVGSYDLSVSYQEVYGGENRTHTQTFTVTDPQPQTIALGSSPVVANALFARTENDGRMVSINWPAMFSAAAVSTGDEESWGNSISVENGGTIGLSEDTGRIKLDLSGSDRRATVICNAPDSNEIMIGDRFSGVAAAENSSYTAGNTMIIQLSNLMDTSGARLTEYLATSDAAALTGTVTLSGQGGEYNVSVETKNLRIETTLPDEIPAGAYTYSVSLTTEQIITEGGGNTSDDDEPSQGDDTPGGGTSPGGSSGENQPGGPSASVIGEGGTVSVSNDGTVIMIPDEGFQISSVTVNGRQIVIPSNGILAGLDSEDEVIVTFERIIDDASLPFVDVTSTSWYTDAVQYVYENNMMTGTSDTTFSPNVTTTRAMIVTILHRLEHEPSVSDSIFADIVSGSYYENAVNWAAANGIVNGISQTSFAPNNPITREQMAAILYRYAQFKGYDVSAFNSLANYTDASQISDYALPAMQWANTEGLILGNTATTLNPQGSATRAEVATILMRFCENIAHV